MGFVWGVDVWVDGTGPKGGCVCLCGWMSGTSRKGGKKGSMCFNLVCEGVCLCVLSCSETQWRRVFFFFFFSFTVLIPHSDHSSSACTREANNASDMSLVEQRLSAPPLPSTNSALHPLLCAVSVCDCVVHWFQPVWWIFLLDYLGLIWWCPLWMPLDRTQSCWICMMIKKRTHFSLIYLLKLIMTNFTH